jgi:hypothetical protein
VKRILFYISGHGYGHATRIMEVIKQVRRQEPETEIHIQTDAPPWLFSLSLANGYRLISKNCDTGAVQQTSFEVDARATLESFSAFHQTWDKRIPEEVDYIKNNGIEIVVGDIPPLAFLAALKAGVPSIAIANFSWDWIYQPYVENHTEFSWVIDVIRSTYKKADLLLRLPFYGDLGAFRSIRDIPLIAGKATESPKAMREKLAVDPDARVVLVALRKADLDMVDLRQLAKLTDYIFIFLHRVPHSPIFHSIAPNAFAFPSLVAASDLVATKPGYGIVAECLTNGTPMLYTSRQEFLEYDVLAQGIEELKLGILLPPEDFFAGNWGELINRILENCPGDWSGRPVDGAEVAARIILSRALKI